MHYRSKKTPEFLNQCSDFHLGRHFFGLVGGFIVGLFVTLPHEIVQIIRILSKMKTMKLWRNILVMTAVMLSFASCSSDEPRYADPEAHEKTFFC